MNTRVIAIFLLFVSLSACKTTKAPTNPRENIATAIPDAIKMLTNEDYKTFFETYVMPETLEMILSSKSMDEMVESFSKKKAQQLLDALNLAKNATPKYDGSGKKVTFSKDDIKGMSKSLVFEKLGKYWYIAN